MKGHVKQRGDRYYAVIYEGRDPVTGRERRRWHPAGTDRAEAERLAARLAATETGRLDAVRSLTFGAYLTSQWLPAKKLHLATSTYRGYERHVARHVMPALGKVAIRRVRYQQIEALYDSLLHPTEGQGLSPKTVYEIHLIIKAASTMHCDAAWSPATSPSSPALPSSVRSHRPRASRSPTKSCASSCAPPSATVSSRSTG
jgi:integrase